MAGMKRAGRTNAQIAKRLGISEREVKAGVAAIRACKSLTRKAGRFAKWHPSIPEDLEDL